ncbi:MAG: hypothetical protein DMG35_03015 [Acidobacteria bacterium]|nr:MAG: hypothetical protein DMG35_03015 [Acidobacteriota bacterium]
MLILDGVERLLERASPDEFGKSEEWMQELLFKYPGLLPIHEIEPAFRGLIPIARELRTSRGPLDLCFVNPEGNITLVETKLWNNPEARRQVVAQIIDYATEVSRWSYTELVSAIRGASNSKDSDPLISAAQAAAGDEFSEAEFTDAVSRNLAGGKFLLLIVGDGIHEGVEGMVEFLQRTPQLGFTLGLVELALFKLGLHAKDGFFVQPRVIARTREVVRAVVEVRSSVPDVSVKCTTPEADAGRTATSGKRPPPLTLALFLDELRKNAGEDLAALAEQTIQEAPTHGLYFNFRIASAILKFEDEDSSETFNFGEIRSDGTLHSGHFSLKCVRLKIPRNIWLPYYDSLAKLIPGSKWLPYEQKEVDGKMAWLADANGNWPSAAPLLRNREQWFKIIEDAVARIRPLLADASK